MTKEVFSPKQEYRELLTYLQNAWQERFDQMDHGKNLPLQSLKTLPQSLLKLWPDLAVSNEEWIVLASALAPHLLPGFYEKIIVQKFPKGGELPELGGAKSGQHRGMIPTGETVQFLLYGLEVNNRWRVAQFFQEDQTFFQKGILWLEPVGQELPRMSGRIILDKAWVDTQLTGKESLPRFGLDFPTKRILTTMDWTDIVLHAQTSKQLADIKTWLLYQQYIDRDKNLGRKVKPGYRALFFGPPGTGKTMTAALLGKEMKREVYRIDLSQVVSKYIGETEKNLENVFRKAESKNWILFFDEADALFGKRTQVHNSHDRFANQEVSYLLQRIEDYPGLLILSSNLKKNMDDAFIRRFHALIYFPAPQINERILLWEKSMPHSLKRGESIQLDLLAKQFEMTGASILNAVHYATLQCLAEKRKVIEQNDLLEGIRNEYFKEEKSLPF